MSAYGRYRALSQLRDDVVFHADLPTPTTTTHITTANLTDLVNAGIAEMYNEALKVAGPEAYLTSTTITTLANVTTYSLPADFLRLISVELMYDTNNIVPLHEFTDEERPILLSSASGWDGSPRKYQLQGKSAIGLSVGSIIELLPKPVAGKVVTVRYQMFPARLVADGDTVDGFAGFEDYAVMYATRRCLMRKGLHDEAAGFLQEMMRIRENIIDLMKHRNAGDPPKTKLVRNNDSYRPYRRW